MNHEALIREHLYIVTREARHWLHLHPHVEQEDLIQEGAIGLTKAARSYDPSRGVPFSAYATVRVRGEIADVVRQRSRPKKARLADGSFPWVESHDAWAYPDGTPRDIEDPGPSVEDQVLAREKLGLLREIPAREREALLRHVVQGDSLHEIGADLGMSESGASLLVKRATARLQRAARS